MNEQADREAATIDGLALALVTVSSVPVLLLDGALRVIAASDSFCSTFHVDPALVAERQLSELGRGEWDSPQVRALLRTTLLGYARVGRYEMEIKRRDREPRRLVLNAIKLDTGDPEVVRILFSVTDITGELAAEAMRQKLAQEKAALQQEAHHRVVSSMQLITSVLLQAGRDLQWRTQPGDASSVLAMAAVERRLAGTDEPIEIAGYLRQLCESLEAALIAEPSRIALVAEASYDMRCSSDAAALGLIVTELVINALSHAFPDARRGTIRVSYGATGDGWTLSVSDNGIGMREASGKGGLGTSVIEALANQLGADDVSVSSEAGTTVSLTCRQRQPAAPQVAAASAH